MISISCTHCKTTLTIDEAFAGGVCRCQHCGAIQTVPSRLRDGQSGATGSKSKTLYRNKAKASVGTGLDELAEIVASSGTLTGSGLRTSARSATPPVASATTQAAPTPIWIKHKRLIIGAGALVLVLIVTLGVLLSRDGGGTAAGASDATFVGSPLFGKTIVYVLDRSSANQATFGDVIQVTFQSLATLGPDRKFQIIFWNNGSELAYPAIEPTFANTQNILAARRALEEVSAFGASEVNSAIQLAGEARADQIVLVTAKGWDLPDDFSQVVQKALSKSSAKLLLISIGTESKALRDLASEVDGRYQMISANELKSAGR